ncbi:uncharacterized protein VTP21DRAFT_1383 [Calcarisporiella thermophila]|uniref:uncharacterized protein n=1 Tax=Calcarisporiella thermophila TaxID=911321 RepID=UPI0037428412
MSAAMYAFLKSFSNPITSRYEIGPQVASSGLWKIHTATRKGSNQKVSVFIFEKKNLDPYLRRGGGMRTEVEKIYELLKKEASQLSRLRHPSLLEVVEPVSESRSEIVFATESILASLANLLGNTDNLSPVPEEIRKFDLDELEIQKGLLQVGKGLQFCHNDAKIVHCNLVPEAIFVNTKGDWKIGGFGFSTYLNQMGENSSFDYFEYDPGLPPYSQKNLDYLAPEYLLDSNLDFANDMFALGNLIYAVHNHGTTLLNTFNNTHKYEQQVQQLSKMDYSSLPSYLQEVIIRLITRNPSTRMTAIEFQSSKYFDNLLVSTMRYLESLPEKTKEEKTQFMKGLLRVLPQFPERVLQRKILQVLLEELKDHSLLPYTLPNVFFICKNLAKEDFIERVLPTLKPIFTVRDPPQTMICLLEKIELLQQKTSANVFKEEIMPLVYHALETNIPGVQDRTLKAVPFICESLDYTTVKSSLFPRIQTLFAQTTVLSVKVSTLICFHSLLKMLDKFTMTEKLLPLLKNIKTKEPAVMIATLAVYEEMGKHLDKEAIAMEILPELWKMSIGPLLNLDQFKRFMRVIRELSTKVEEQHSRQLSDLKSLEEQQKSYPTSEAKIVQSDTGLVDFEKLVSSTTSVNGELNGFNAIVSSGNSTKNSAEMMFGEFSGVQSNSTSSTPTVVPSSRPSTSPTISRQRNTSSLSSINEAILSATAPRSPIEAGSIPPSKPTASGFTTTTQFSNNASFQRPVSPPVLSPSVSTTTLPRSGQNSLAIGQFPILQTPPTSGTTGNILKTPEIFPSISIVTNAQSATTPSISAQKSPGNPTFWNSGTGILQPTKSNNNSIASNTKNLKPSSADLDLFDPLSKH